MPFCRVSVRFHFACFVRIFCLFVSWPFFTHHVLSAGRTLSPTFVTKNTDIVQVSGFYTTEIVNLLDILPESSIRLIIYICIYAKAIPFVIYINNHQDLRTHARQFPLHWDALGLHTARGVLWKEHPAKTKIREKMPEKEKIHCAWKKGIHPVFKVLKNAARATIESNPNLRGSSLPPVSIVLASNSQVREMVLMVLFSDLGRYNSIFFPGLHYPHFWPRRWNPSRPSIRLFLWKRTFHHLLPSFPRWRRCCSTPTPPQRRARTRSSRTPASLDPWWRQSIGIVDEILNP